MGEFPEDEALSNEEMIAQSLAVALEPWLKRIKELETESIGLRAEVRLLKELALMNYGDAPSGPTKTTGPFGPAPRISRSGKDAH